SQIERWKVSLSGNSNVIFHGFKPHKDTPAFIKAFDLLIAPYCSEVYVKGANQSNNIAQWMSPLKIFEYMSSGVPFITSDLPVLREVLVHKVNAFLCRPENSDEWVAAIRELRRHPEVGKQMALQAKSDFLERYT